MIYHHLNNINIKKYFVKYKDKLNIDLESLKIYISVIILGDPKDNVE